MTSQTEVKLRKITKIEICDHRLWPGTDYHEPSVCSGEMELDWTNPVLSPQQLADKVLARWLPHELHTHYAEMGSEGQEARAALDELVRRASK